MLDSVRESMSCSSSMSKLITDRNRSEDGNGKECSSSSSSSSSIASVDLVKESMSCSSMSKLITDRNGSEDGNGKGCCSSIASVVDHYSAFMTAALSIKHQVVEATWKQQQQDTSSMDMDMDMDPTVYTGLMGTAFTCLRSYQATATHSDLLLAAHIVRTCAALALAHPTSTSTSRHVTFLCGRGGIYALGVVVMNYLGDHQSVARFLHMFHQVAQEKALPAGPEEGGFGMSYDLLYGRAGFLWAALFIKSYLGESAVPNDLVIPVVEAILAGGRAGACVNQTCPLMYRWHGTRYWGAPHGLAGILHVLLHFALSKDDAEDVKCTLRYMMSNRFPKSGNYPSSEGNPRDTLVQWSHGATGMAITLCKASQIDEHVQREIINHRSLKHPNIIKFKEVFLTPTHLAIVMEYAAGGELFERICAAGRFNEDEARYYFQQLISGVSYCHSMQICHRDLKLENTLLDDSPEPRLKICDFGYSKSAELHSQPKSTVGTPAYIAPEVLSRKEYDGKIADVWSCGVTLYVMLVGAYPFEDPEDPINFKITIQRILSVHYSIPDYVRISQECNHLLSRLFVANPDKRITIEEIKKHPWFMKNLAVEYKDGEDDKIGVNDDKDEGPCQREEEIVSIIQEARKDPMGRTALLLENELLLGGSMDLDDSELDADLDDLDLSPDFA